MGCRRRARGGGTAKFLIKVARAPLDGAKLQALLVEQTEGDLARIFDMDTLQFNMIYKKLMSKMIEF